MRISKRTTGLALLAAGALGLTAGARAFAGLADQPAQSSIEEKVPSIKEIMQQSHRCQNNYIYLVRRELQKEDPDWYILENRSEDLVRMGKFLGKNTPPRGSQESWAHFTSIYVAHATLLNDAAQRQDKKTAQTHQLGLSGMCATCHRAHKGR